jgi:hypothetical protein
MNNKTRYVTLRERNEEMRKIKKGRCKAGDPEEEH